MFHRLRSRGRNKDIARSDDGRRSEGDQTSRRDFTIRNYRPADRIEVLEIAGDSFAGVSLDENIEKAFGKVGKGWREHKKDVVDGDILSNPALLLVAETEGRVVGFLCGRVYPERSTGQIANLAVHEMFRGRKIGRALVQEALTRFRRRGMRYARIETLEQNEAGRAFYPSLGFEEIGRQVFYMKRL